ncbi:conserved Plasmodium protein, unknown function [Plasmodium ovale]|uniref:TRIP4/RQT4 C2HC5-type zinc finger domain-containing protein n=1 Tax=Plasmodium ovale TaxID=36330 RepID=A0A1D3TKA5_PLAOA|nr:conserved Plasmodium protein, unknown function [Plasmodium ovale]
MDNNDRYALYLRGKILKYFNLKNDELELTYIKSILKCKSYDLYDSIYILNESLYEKSSKNVKCSLTNVKKFTQDLIDARKKFFTSVEENNGMDVTSVASGGDLTQEELRDGLSDRRMKNSINNFFQMYGKEKVTECGNKCAKGKFEEGTPSSQKKGRENRKVVEKTIRRGYNGLEEEANQMDSNTAYKREDSLPLEGNETVEQRQNDNFSLFNVKEYKCSLKTAINSIEKAKDMHEKDEKVNKGEKMKKEEEKEKKRKNTQICICNGQNHKIYANCLMCGKVYCAKIKYKNCLFCDHPLYEAAVINDLLIPPDDADSIPKKIPPSIRNADMLLHKLYFDQSNVHLKKALDLRDRMRRNALNEDQTRIIDDSIDWFEDDIKNEFGNQDVHFSRYDDEIKNDIINKYHEIFGKRFGNININIDLVNMKITENKDFSKIKEFNDYINEKEKEYRDMLERKKGHSVNPKNVHNFLSKKENTHLGYINDLRRILFTEIQTKGRDGDDKFHPFGEEKDSIGKREKCNIRHRYNVVIASDEEDDGL